MSISFNPENVLDLTFHYVGETHKTSGTSEKLPRCWMIGFFGVDSKCEFPFYY